MRVRPDHVGMNERRSDTGTAVRNCARQCAVTDYRIGAINLFKVKIWKTGNQARNISARSLNLNRNRDGVAVVLYKENNGQAEVRGRIHRLPEFAFAAGAVAKRDVGDFVAVELDVFEFAVIAGEFLSGVRMQHVIATSLGASYGVKNLCPGTGRLSDDIEPFESPMRGHLPAAGAWIVRSAYSPQEHFVRSSAERKTECTVAIVREEPVVAGLHCEAGGYGDRLMPGARDLEKDFLLALEHDLAIIEAPRCVHQPISFHELLP